MLRFTFISLMLTLLVISAAGQVVVSDDPTYVPENPNYIFNVGTNGHGRLNVDANGAKVSGLFEADSAIIHGSFTVTNDTGSFNWWPNKTFPGPIHDLMRVSTKRYTIMGGNTINVSFWPFVIWTSTQPLKAMGVNTETPNNMLDVNNGDIDVNTSTFGYMIGDQYVLRHKGITSNMLVGVNAGFNLTGGNNLTFVGSGAGQNVTGANDFTFIGYQAGFTNTGGSTNTFIGSKAGYSEMGDENVYVGWMSGYNNGSTGFHNTFVGNVSGFNNTFGNNNTFLGIGSGITNATGSNNVMVGAGANVGAPGLFNGVAIGSGTTVMNNAQMILGDNSIRVGIGLNGDISGPGNKLEIDAGIAGMNATPPSTVGASGLRLRDLHSLTLTVPNPGPGVLSVDASGDVIYVPSSASSSAVTICTSTPPFNNVMKLVATNTLCQTNITDLFPTNSVGINNTAPNNALDVSAGDIDANTPTNGYMIGDQYVLRHKGFTDMMLVGVNAGLSLTGGSNLTFVGSGAGQNVINASNYTFLGYQAGFSNTGGSTNTFIGSQAGYSEMGDENVYVGWKSGYNSTNASYHNTFVGNVSGTSNKIGDNNTFLGIGTGGINQSGNSNVALGANAGMFGSINQNNSVAIGAGSQVKNSNQMILGDNTIQVGIGLSADISGPQNKLEIDAGINGMNPTPVNVLGASGLRLRDLHSFTLPSTNSRNVFLSVDNFGDVILVPAPGSSSSAADNGLSTSGPTAGAIHIGQSIGASGDPGQLLDNREIPMYGYNLNFKGDLAIAQDRVEIGDNTILPLTPLTGAKLNVQTQTEHTAGLFVNRTNNFSMADSWGVGGLKLLGSNMENIGVYGYGEIDPFVTPSPLIYSAIGVKGIGVGQAFSGAVTVAYGVWGEAMDNQTPVNYGGFFRAYNGLGANYAVFGDAVCTSCTPGPGNPPGPNYAGYFNGDVYIAGLYGPSDQKLKKDINNLQSGLDLVMKLRPVTYEYRQSEFPSMTLPGGKQYGLIAQEVEAILPDLVMDNTNPARTDADGNVLDPAVDFKSMSYQELIPVLIKAVQELQEQNTKQDVLIQQLTSALNSAVTSQK
jgi:trimeric autotransporter adhesin